MRIHYIFLFSTIIFAACNTGGKNALFTLLPPNETGISFQNDLKESDSLNALTFTNIYHGSGVGIADFNNDGRPDIFFAGNMVSSQLYLNDGHFRFREVTETAGLSTSAWITGVSVVDINQDGWQDLYLCVANLGDSSKASNLLFINKGTDASGVPRFEEMARAYGLDDKSYSMQAAFFDYDLDGDLDMYLLNNGLASVKTNYQIRPKWLHGESETTDCLYRNDGGAQHPHFTNVSKQAGIQAEGFGLGVAISDVNKDGYPDIYVSNDYISCDLLWMNNGNGTFTDRNNEYLQHNSLNGMGVDIADINNDGWYDIMQLDMLPENNYRRKMMFTKPNYNSFLAERKLNYQAQFLRNSLQVNNGPGPDSAISFREIGRMAGVAATDWSWSPLLADFDNDGWKDLFVSNGYRRDITDLDFIVYDYKANNRFGSRAYKRSTYKSQLEKLPEIKISDYMFRNNGDLSFSDKSNDWGMRTAAYSTGAACADLDDDGDLDLVVNTIDGPVLIYRNNLLSATSDSVNQGNHFLKIALKGDSLNRDGIGAEIRVYTGKKCQWQEHFLSRGYLSSANDQILFGIDHAIVADSVIVNWPDRKRQTLYSVQANSKTLFDHADATFKREPVPHRQKSIFTDISQSAGIDYVHREDEYIDFQYNALMPYKASQNGPCMATGDMNGDGLDDVFIGGSNAGQRYLLFQQHDGSFLKTVLPVKENYEDVAAVLFDADNDHDLDLYVVSGSTEYPAGSIHYADRLYINDGKGRFTERNDLLPANFFSGSCVAAGDFDRDGDLDLFVGGRFVPGNYPFPERSRLLRNDSGHFVDVTKECAASLPASGIVNAALWVDVDHDGYPDLLTAGEFTAIDLYHNERGRLIKQDRTGDLSMSGWWTSMAAADFDGDGDIDLVAGNLGSNTQYHASIKEPLWIFAGDFDHNGSTDPVIAMFSTDQSGHVALFPEVPRDQLFQQVPAFRKNFERYHSYAAATLEDVLGREALADSYQKSITTLKSMYFENEGNGRFKAIPLPPQAQSAPIQQLLVTDFNGDHKPDLIAGGNDYSWDSRNGFSDASSGYILQGSGSGEFKLLPYAESGFYVKDAIRSLCTVNKADSSVWYLVGRNREALQVFSLNKK